VRVNGELTDWFETMIGVFQGMMCPVTNTVRHYGRPLSVSGRPCYITYQVTYQVRPHLIQGELGAMIFCLCFLFIYFFMAALFSGPGNSPGNSPGAAAPGNVFVASSM